MLNPWFGLVILFAAQIGWVLIIRALPKSMDAEWPRKLFHTGSGVILLSLPYLFETTWPVLIWGSVSLGALGVLAVHPELRSRMAGQVYEVKRVSYGDFYFVLGVMALFFFARPAPYTYFVPLTLLAFADTASALVGKYFGRHKYEATEGRKSIEGSAAFFIVTLVATLAWMPALPNANPGQIALIALALAFIVMLLEAISWRGLDNLLIPLGAYVLLRTYLMMSTAELLTHMLAAALLVTFVLSWRHRTTLNDSALITGALFGYLAWTVPGKLFGTTIFGVQGWAWLLMPAATFLVYNLLFAPRLLEQRHETHNVDAILSAIFAGAVWLYLAFLYAQPAFIFPYSVSFAAVVLNMWLEQRMTQRRLTRRVEVGFSSMVALLMILPAIALLLGQVQPPTAGEAWWIAVLLAGAAALGVFTAMALRLLAEGAMLLALPRDWRWHVRALASFCGSAVAALTLLFVELN